MGTKLLMNCAKPRNVDPVLTVVGRVMVTVGVVAENLATPDVMG